MTRSITIVNTSNWDGEDWVVRTRNHSSEDKWESMRLSPGQKMALNPQYQEFSIDADNSKVPEPFNDKDGGGQIFPIAYTRFEGIDGKSGIPKRAQKDNA